jgi:hypothetical protein
MEKRKSFSGNEIPAIHPIACSLYRLSYPNSLLLLLYKLPCFCTLFLFVHHCSLCNWTLGC